MGKRDGKRVQGGVTMKKLKIALEKMVIIAGIILTVWFLLSYLEIVSKNLSENPTYSDINFFRIAEEYGK